MNSEQNIFDSAGDRLAPGMTVAHYRIVGPLGAGGMGEVHLARDTSLQRKVALKLLRPELCGQSDPRKRFVREAQTVASLEHPNIIGIYEVSEYLGRPYFTMPYIEGHTLAEYIRARTYTTADLLNISIAICDGLAAAHDRVIIHRDLKPGNIMLDHARRVYLLDFGLAVAPEWEGGENTDDTLTKLTLAGVPSGTVAYMAPEQLQGHPPSVISDIFALGVTLYELATGEHPFPGATIATTASSILRDEPKSVVALNPSIPADFSRIVGRCLRKDPDRRFQTARDIRNELVDLRESLAGTAREQPRPSARRDQAISLAEREFPLDADLVRRLSRRVPQMIGDRLTYLDNEVASDILVIYIHGMGLDERSLSEVLRSVPYRAVAPSLYGFDLHAPNRIPLPLGDHSTLMRAFMKRVISESHARKVLAVGVSSGSDQLLHMLSADRGMADEIDGLLLMGCNLDLRTCFNSRVFASFYAEDPAQTLQAVREVGANLTTLNEWLLVHAYLVQVMNKFASDTDALRQYAGDLVRPFETRGLDQFIDWYHLACDHVPSVRFVFFSDETAPLNDLLQRHLDDGVLGNHNIEQTIVREHLAHMELLSSSVVVRHTLEMVAQLA